MRQHKAEEDRQQHFDRLLHATQIQHDEHNNHKCFGPKFVLMKSERQKRRQSIDSGGDRNRDCQHIVDDQCATGNQPHIRSDQLGGDTIAATAGWKQLDDLVICQCDDEHGDCGRDRHVQAEMRIVT